ncbi:hypothetical protein ACHFCA_12330 [Delftia tsuruhatensis]
MRSLVEMHGGSVQALSEGPGQGSELRLRLPLPAHAPADASAHAPADVPSCPDRPQARSPGTRQPSAASWWSMTTRTRPTPCPCC